MQIEIKIDPTCEEPKIIVMTDKVTDEVNLVIRKLSEEAPQVLAGFREDVVEVLEQSEIIRFYAASGKIFAVTTQGEYSLRRRLYELEEMLDKRDFVRISNSEIINLRKAKGFDLSFAGTICVTMSNGDAVYVSRRYVSKIKQVLGL
ncbi:MAG TPA: LytTR family DNA-binding domain-containing protein [Lachnospiraceae bacterium]|jgi:DNA-binding LytR/AlgR family response regulator|nr:LytTR family DNA-binding domain-containing protein [Lachnospiraceae bacterium]